MKTYKIYSLNNSLSKAERAISGETFPLWKWLHFVIIARPRLTPRPSLTISGEVYVIMINFLSSVFLIGFVLLFLGVVWCLFRMMNSYAQQIGVSPVKRLFCSFLVYGYSVKAPVSHSERITFKGVQVGCLF